MTTSTFFPYLHHFSNPPCAAHSGARALRSAPAPRHALLHPSTLGHRPSLPQFSRRLLFSLSIPAADPRSPTSIKKVSPARVPPHAPHTRTDSPIANPAPPPLSASALFSAPPPLSASALFHALPPLSASPLSSPLLFSGPRRCSPLWLLSASHSSPPRLLSWPWRSFFAPDPLPRPRRSSPPHLLSQSQRSASPRLMLLAVCSLPLSAAAQKFHL